MKKIFLIFILIFTSTILVKAQDEIYKPVTSFGIKQGVNYSKVTFSPGVKQSGTLGYQGGFVFKYQNEKLFALQIELNYMQKGWTEDWGIIENSYSRRLNYLELPFITQIVLGKRSLKYYINLGTSVGYLLSEKENLTINNEFYRREYYEKKLDKNMDFTGLGELGVIYDSKIGSFQLGVRYQLSLTNLFKTTSDTYYYGSQSTVWSFSVSYFIFDNK